MKETIMILIILIPSYFYPKCIEFLEVYNMGGITDQNGIIINEQNRKE